MSQILALVISLCVATGVWLLLSSDLFRIVIGLGILGTAVNLSLFLAGRPGTLTPPIIEPGMAALAEQAANPLPQALVLTAIVIGFALLCFSLLLAARLSQVHGHEDVASHQASEPRQGSHATPDKPPVME
jgi:multicomponent Na+:H+ antiporter subunit C